MAQVISGSEIKSLCQLVQAYSKGEITKEDFWKKRDAFFPEQDLFEVRK